MTWEQLEPTASHISYLLISSFLISFVLFTNFLRNRCKSLHLSEPPIALLFGIIVGPYALAWLTPNFCASRGCGPEGEESWGWGDDVIQEITRMIVGIQVFTVGVELPKAYASRHWKSVTMLLGPVMTFGWLVCAFFCWFIFKVDVRTALIVAACLTPTDPVLAASILSNSQFSERIPKRIRDMLAAESGCNDGVSFPFLYAGLFLIREYTAGEAIKEWFLITILWQCLLGTFVGLVIGTVFHRVLRISERKDYIDGPGFIVFYLLLAIFSIGVGSTLGSDDFLVAFGAGYGFSRDGWFAEKTKETDLGNIIDLLLNSAMFVYLGTIMPFGAFNDSAVTPWITPVRLVGFLVCVLLFRRLPIVLATYRWIPDIRTFKEALFSGWFGPMGLGGLFLAIEARAVLETGTSTPYPHPPPFESPYNARQESIFTVWPVVSFIVLGSTMVHGLSVLFISAAGHLMRSKAERADVPAGETDPLMGMEHEGDDENE